MVMFTNGVNVGIKATGVVNESSEYKFYSGVEIASVSAANPAIVTTLTAHDFLTGETIRVAEVNSVGVGVNAEHTVTMLSATTFSIPINNADAGFGGWCGRRLYQHKVKDTNVDAVVRSRFTQFAENEDDVI